jgi:hypothetical protein
VDRRLSQSQVGVTLNLTPRHELRVVGMSSRATTVMYQRTGSAIFSAQIAHKVLRSSLLRAVGRWFWRASRWISSAAEKTWRILALSSGPHEYVALQMPVEGNPRCPAGESKLTHHHRGTALHVGAGIVSYREIPGAGRQIRDCVGDDAGIGNLHGVREGSCAGSITVRPCETWSMQRRKTPAHWQR